MLKSTLLITINLCLACKTNQGQTSQVNIDTLLVGKWNGTSLCQVKNSPCHDETVIYHISKREGVDTFYINAGKIVNGEEVGMGILPLIYNKKTKQLTSTAYGIWTFNLDDAKLEGTLLVNGNLYRKIVLHKHY
jgi:hypothetical protein